VVSKCISNVILARTQLTYDDKILRHLPICPPLLRLVRHVTCPLPRLTAKPSAFFNHISSINDISLTELCEIKMPLAFTYTILYLNSSTKPWSHSRPQPLPGAVATPPTHQWSWSKVLGRRCGGGSRTTFCTTTTTQLRT